MWCNIYLQKQFKACFFLCIGGFTYPSAGCDLSSNRSERIVFNVGLDSPLSSQRNLAAKPIFIVGYAGSIHKEILCKNLKGAGFSNIVFSEQSNLQLHLSAYQSLILLSSVGKHEILVSSEQELTLFKGISSKNTIRVYDSETIDFSALDEELYVSSNVWKALLPSAGLLNKNIFVFPSFNDLNEEQHKQKVTNVTRKKKSRRILCE